MALGINGYLNIFLVDSGTLVPSTAQKLKLTEESVLAICQDTPHFLPCSVSKKLN